MFMIGVDYHPSFQQIAFLDQETGECGDWMWRNGCEYSPSLEFGSYAGQLGTGHGVK
jgi:predicted oxidoreductase